MLPPFLGQLLTVATAGVLGVTGLLAIWSGIRGSWFWFRVSALAGTSGLGVYGLFFALGLLLARDQVVPPGQPVRFCGLDCHLHVHVGSARRGAVEVQFSSNAVRVPEYPAELEFALMDASGRTHRPLNQVPNRPLMPDERWSYELKFPETVDPSGASLVVTWKRGLDYLVPGAGNPLVQRHTRLALQ